MGHTRLEGQKKELVDTGEKAELSIAALTSSPPQEEIAPEETKNRSEKHMENLRANYGEPRASESAKMGESGVIKKRSDTKLKTLEKLYGPIAPEDWDRNMTLKDLLERTGASSLGELLGKRETSGSSPSDARVIPHEVSINPQSSDLLSVLDIKPVFTQTVQLSYDSGMVSEKGKEAFKEKYGIELTGKCQFYQSEQGTVIIDNLDWWNKSAQVPQGNLFDGKEHKVISVSPQSGTYAYIAMPDNIDPTQVSILGTGGPMGNTWQGEIKKLEQDEHEFYKTLIYTPPDAQGNCQKWEIDSNVSGNKDLSKLTIYQQQVPVLNPGGPITDPAIPTTPADPNAPPPPPPPLDPEGEAFEIQFLKERGLWRDGYMFGYGEGTLPPHQPFAIPNDPSWQAGYGTGIPDGKRAAQLFPHTGVPDYPIFVPKPFTPLGSQNQGYTHHHGHGHHVQGQTKKSFLSPPPEDGEPALPNQEIMQSLGKKDKAQAYKMKDGSVFTDIERNDGSRQQVIYDKEGNLLTQVSVDKEGNQVLSTFLTDGTSKVETSDGKVMTFDKDGKRLETYDETPHESEVKKDYWQNIPSGAVRIDPDPIISRNLKSADTIDTYALPNGDRLSEVYTASDGKRHQMVIDGKGNLKHSISEDLRSGEQVNVNYNSDGSMKAESSRGYKTSMDQKGLTMLTPDGRVIASRYTYDPYNPTYNYNPTGNSYMSNNYVTDMSYNMSSPYMYSGNYGGYNPYLFGSTPYSFPDTYSLGNLMLSTSMGMGYPYMGMSYGMGYPYMGMGYGMGNMLLEGLTLGAGLLGTVIGYNLF